MMALEKLFHRAFGDILTDEVYSVRGGRDTYTIVTRSGMTIFVSRVPVEGITYPYGGKPDIEPARGDRKLEVLDATSQD